MRKKRTKSEIFLHAQEVAKSKGGQCLSNSYIHANEKLLWKCKAGHEWWAIYNNIKGGSWCRKCSLDLARNGVEGARKLAKSFNGECLSLEYKNALTKLEWKCEFGHTWCAKYNNVKTGHWCPVCANRVPYSIEYINEYLREFGIVCVSSEYKYCKAKLNFVCAKGHEWSSTFDAIKNKGRLCKRCFDNSSERKLEKILNSILDNDRFFL